MSKAINKIFSLYGKVIHEMLFHKCKILFINEHIFENSSLGFYSLSFLTIINFLFHSCLVSLHFVFFLPGLITFFVNFTKFYQCVVLLCLSGIHSFLLLFLFMQIIVFSYYSYSDIHFLYDPFFIFQVGLSTGLIFRVLKILSCIDEKKLPDSH